MEDLTQMKCELSQIVHEKYQSNAYGLDGCTRGSYTRSKVRELGLLIFLNESCVKCGKKDPKLSRVRFLETEEVRPIIIHNHYAGAVSGDANMVFNQAEDALEWRIYHGMGFMPAVTIVDENGFRMDAAVQYLGLNEIQITFNTPSKGKALLT